MLGWRAAGDGSMHLSILGWGLGWGRVCDRCRRSGGLPEMQYGWGVPNVPDPDWYIKWGPDPFGWGPTPSLVHFQAPNDPTYDPTPDPTSGWITVCPVARRPPPEHAFIHPEVGFGVGS